MTTQQTEIQTRAPPYFKRAFVAIILVIPMSFGLNVPINFMESFMPFWGIIMINSIVISSYMAFIIPRAFKLLSTWLNSIKTNGVN